MAVYLVERDLKGITRDQLAAAQRRAIETLVYLYEVAHISNQREMYEKYVQAGNNPQIRGSEAYPRFAVKMATGSSAMGR